MTPDEAWARGFARQADADLRAFELYAMHPEAVSCECHRLLFLQMACEKLCKAHLSKGESPPKDLETSHAHTEAILPIILRQQLQRLGEKVRKKEGLLTHFRHLAREIELLNPAVKDGGRRPDNCEYPWRVDDEVVSPLDHTFYPTRLVLMKAGKEFQKLLRMAIDDLLI